MKRIIAPDTGGLDAACGATTIIINIISMGINITSMPGSSIIVVIMAQKITGMQGFARDTRVKNSGDQLDFLKR